eukprot:gene12311-14442_t
MSRQLKNISSDSLLQQSSFEKSRQRRFLKNEVIVWTKEVPGVATNIWLIGNRVLDKSYCKDDPCAIYKRSYNVRLDCYIRTKLPTRLPTPRRGSAAVIRNERYVYLLGGWDSPTSVERLDLHTMEFITCAPMLTGRINLGALLIIGEDPALLAVGGHTPSGESLASIEIYDPLFDTWFQDEYIALSTPRHSPHVAYFG